MLYLLDPSHDETQWLVRNVDAPKQHMRWIRKIQHRMQIAEVSNPWSYIFHIPSIEINDFVTKHIARKTISLNVPLSWWSFYEMVISLKHSTSTSSCNMSKIMNYRTFSIIDQRKELINTSIVRSKLFSFKTFFPWLLMGLTSYLLVERIIFFIRISCLNLWARFTFNSFMKTKTRFDGRRPLTTKNIIQNLNTILKS